MKTKHILTAMALPAMFAACTADDIVSENNGLQQDQRAKLSKDFVLNVNSEVESRYAVEEGATGLNFNFEEGDKIGANLIDVFSGGADFDPKDPATWTIINTVAPALPFIKEGEIWKSANEDLGIGNYLFTNPFNPADKNRAAAGYELPVVVQYSSENPNAHIEAYNKAVAAQITYEGQTSANADLKNIFAYPMIRINFDKNLDVKKVTKVVLAKNYYALNPTTNKTELYDGTPFIYKGAFNHQDVAKMFNPATLEAEKKLDKKLTDEAYWASKQTSDFIIDEKDDDVVSGETTTHLKGWVTLQDAIEGASAYADIKTTPYFIYEMDETVVANSIDVRFMIPSIESLEKTEIDNNERITMYVCTDKGNFEMELTDLDNYQFSPTTLVALKNAAMQRNTSYTLKTKTNALVPSSNASVFFNNIVSTAADWNKLVEEYGDLKKYSAEYNKKDENGNKINKDAVPMIVNIISDKFALTSDLKMPEVAEFIIKSDVNVEGEVTLKNIKVEDGKVIVKKDATLTTDPTLDAASVEVEKGGNLVFAAEYNEDEELVAYDAITTVHNHGTVTVPAGVIAQFTLQNADKDAVLNVGAAASRAAEVAEAKAILAGYNYGTVNNYSVIDAAGFTNYNPDETTEDALGTSTGAEGTGYEYDTDAQKWNGTPTVKNFATFNAKGAVTNKGLFENHSVLTSNFVGAATFANTGVLDIKSGAETYIDDNQGGTIILAELTPAKGLTIYKARKNADFNCAKKDGNYVAGNYAYRGTIKHTLAGKTTEALDLSASPVNYLVANADVEIGKTYTWTDSSTSPATTRIYPLETLEVTDGIVTLAARTGAGTQTSPYVYPAQVANLIANGEVEMDGEWYTTTGDYKTGAHVGKLTVNAGAEFGVPAESWLQISLANIDTKPSIVVDEETLAEGKVSVVGTLEFTQNHPTATVYNDSTWPKAGDKYAKSDFTITVGGVEYTKNIEINKDAEVKCVANSAPSNVSPNKDAVITISDGNLYNVTKTGTWYANKASDAVWTVKITSDLDMQKLITETTSSTTDTNYDYKAVLTGAKEVILDGGSILNLKKGTATMALTKLTVKGEYGISGSKNVDILKVDALEVPAGSMLKITDGYLVVNETAVVGRGNENINIQGGYTGMLIAYTSDDEIVRWDLANSVWAKSEGFVMNYSNATVNASTATDLAWAVESGVGEVTLTDNVEMSESLIFTTPTVVNFGGKEISSTHEIVTGQNAVIQIDGVEMTLKDAKVSSETCYGISVKNGGVLTLIGGEFSGNTSAVQATKGTVTIDGGTFYNESRSQYLLNHIDSAYKDGTAKIEVVSGIFYNFNPAANVAETPGQGDSVSFVAEGSAVTKVERYRNNVWETVVTGKNGTIVFAESIFDATWDYDYRYTVSKTK